MLVLAGVSGAHAASAPAPVRASAVVQQSSDEYSVKAAFLYNFVRYVKWPDSAFKDAEAPLVVAVLGKDPFGRVLDDVFRDKKAGARRIVVKRFETLDDLGACHVLFVPEREEIEIVRVRTACADKAVLVVAESVAAAEQGAQVAFYLERARVKFAINPVAVRSAGLEVGSELLKLARIVEPRIVDPRTEAERR